MFIEIFGLKCSYLEHCVSTGIICFFEVCDQVVQRQKLNLGDDCDYDDFKVGDVICDFKDVNSDDYYCEF